MSFFTRNGIQFHYLQKGSGLPLVFQHGLGSEADAVFGLLEPPLDIRLLCMDSRGHGKTTPVGPPEHFNFDCFADDLKAFLDELKLKRVIVGGSSMGAAVALNFALRYPHRIEGLILLRPAWLETPNRSNLQAFELIAKLLREQGTQHGLERFKATELYRRVASESSDSANSLAGQFLNPRAVEAVVRLERIPQDCPSPDLNALRRISVPTLVLACRLDPIHPFEFGQILAHEIPGAEFKELTPKSVDLARFNQEVNSFVWAFLKRHFTLIATVSS